MTSRSKLLIVALVTAMTLAIALPALAAPFVLREEGSNECSPSQDVWTRIKAAGDHLHVRKDTGQAVGYAFPPDGVQRVSNRDWGIFALEWQLANEQGFAYSFSSSFGFCSS